MITLAWFLLCAFIGAVSDTMVQLVLGIAFLMVFGLILIDKGVL